MRYFITQLLLFISIVVFCSSCGCSRIDTGEVGLRKAWDGKIQSDVLAPGFHQTWVGEIIVFAAKEILLAEENLTPASKDKSTLKDFDVTFTYLVDTKETFYLYTKYSETVNLHAPKSNETFLMGSFVSSIVRASAYSAVSEYDALEVNNNRKAIEDRIKALANEKLANEKLGDKVTVNLVNVKNIELADEIVLSANNVSNVQNQLIAKKTEVEIAIQEGLKIKELAAQTDAKYVELLRAQTQMKMADALLEAAKKGSTMWVIPQNLTAFGAPVVK